VLRRDRIVAMVTLSLLNVFALGAGLAVVKLTPRSSLKPEPPSVAIRDIVRAAGSSVTPSDPSAPLPGNGLGIELLGLLGAHGGNVNAVVIDATTRRTLFDQRAKIAAVPASTTKVVTSTAALAALGPDHRLTTKVMKGAGGGIVLVGGGDPTLTARPSRGYPAYASLPDLAKRTAAALKSAGTSRVRVDYDASLYQGSRTAAGWKPNYVPDGEIAPVTALTVDEGRVVPGERSRVADPPGAATQAFVRLLRQNGINATAGGRTQAAPTAEQIAAVQSPPVSVLVERLMTDSDNDLAEAMIRQVAIKRKRPPSFAGGVQAVQEVLTQLGVGEGVRLSDGSGLSTSNRITPMALARIISLAASGKRPELRAMITGLPVAGFSGTLAGRYATVAVQGAGVVRAKTGTLANVSTLAGITSDADGRVLAFAFMAGNANSEALDQLASIVAACGCR
jgi:D-alanyl-D-alanine carboxypeptidase